LKQITISAIQVLNIKVTAKLPFREAAYATVWGLCSNVIKG